MSGSDYELDGIHYCVDPQGRFIRYMTHAEITEGYDAAAEAALAQFENDGE